MVFDVVAGRPGVARIQVKERLYAVRLGTDEPVLNEMELLLDGSPLTLSKEELVEATVFRQLPPGPHQLTCRRDDGAVISTSFTVAEDGSTSALCTFDEIDSLALYDPWGWVTVGLSVGAIGGGIGYLVSWSRDLEIAQQRNQDLRTSKHVAGGVLLGVGTALAIGSYFVFTRHSHQSGTDEVISVSPSLFGPAGTGFGVSASGRF